MRKNVWLKTLEWVVFIVSALTLWFIVNSVFPEELSWWQGIGFVLLIIIWIFICIRLDVLLTPIYYLTMDKEAVRLLHKGKAIETFGWQTIQQINYSVDYSEGALRHYVHFHTDDDKEIIYEFYGRWFRLSFSSRFNAYDYNKFIAEFGSIAEFREKMNKEDLLYLHDEFKTELPLWASY